MTTPEVDVDPYPHIAHGVYKYTKYGCRCDICRAAKAVIVRRYRDRAGITKFAPPRVKQPRKPQPRQPLGGTISKPRELRIISRQTPEPKPPTFTPTPVNDCGEPVGRRWCRKPYPCPEHGDDK